MKKEDLYKNIIHPNKLNVRLRSNVKSKYSKSFCIGQSREDKANGLYEIFELDSNIEKDRWHNLFDMAIGGDGSELRRIDTLHSSSLLALLFFCSVSKSNPIVIDKTKYTKCFFEVKSKVFHDSSDKDKPSNMDVVLYSPDEKKLLYLESKFSEYLSHGKAYASEKYEKFLNAFAKAYPSIKVSCKEKVGKNGENVNILEIERSEGRNSIYLAGIKQMVSHIIGIATNNPIRENNPDFLSIYQDNSLTIEFRTIIFNINDAEYDVYSSFYNAAVDAIISNKVLQIVLKTPEHKYLTDFEIGHVISYQEILKDNPKYCLPEKVKAFYGF